MSYSQGVIGNTKNYGNKKGKPGQVEHTIGNTIGRIGSTIGIRLNIGNTKEPRKHRNSQQNWENSKTSNLLGIVYFPMFRRIPMCFYFVFSGFSPVVS